MYHGIRLPFNYIAKLLKNIEICKFFGYFFRTFSQKKRPAPRVRSKPLSVNCRAGLPHGVFVVDRVAAVYLHALAVVAAGAGADNVTLLHLHHPHRGLHIFFLHFTSSLLSLGIIGASSILLSLNRSLQCLMFNYFFFSNDFYVL